MHHDLNGGTRQGKTHQGWRTAPFQPIAEVSPKRRKSFPRRPRSVSRHAAACTFGCPCEVSASFRVDAPSREAVRDRWPAETTSVVPAGASCVLPPESRLRCGLYVLENGLAAERDIVHDGCSGGLAVATPQRLDDRVMVVDHRTAPGGIGIRDYGSHLQPNST
jgi:hypothetical protein